MAGRNQAKQIVDLALEAAGQIPAGGKRWKARILARNENRCDDQNSFAFERKNIASSESAGFGPSVFCQNEFRTRVVEHAQVIGELGKVLPRYANPRFTRTAHLDVAQIQIRCGEELL